MSSRCHTCGCHDDCQCSSGEASLSEVRNSRETPPSYIDIVNIHLRLLAEVYQLRLSAFQMMGLAASASHISS